MKRELPLTPANARALWRLHWHDARSHRGHYDAVGGGPADALAALDAREAQDPLTRKPSRRRVPF